MQNLNNNKNYFFKKVGGYINFILTLNSKIKKSVIVKRLKLKPGGDSHKIGQ